MSEVEVVRLVFVWHEEQEAAINKLDKNKKKNLQWTVYNEVKRPKNADVATGMTDL